MPQEMSVEELRRIAGLHKGLTPESWLMGWAAEEIDRLRAEVAATKYSLQLDEELIGTIQRIITVLNNRPVTPNVEFSGGAPLHGAASAGTQGSASPSCED